MNRRTSFFKRAAARLCCMLSVFAFGAGTAEADTAMGKWDDAEIKAFPMRQWDDGGTLLFSDSPEYVREDGILYADVVQGKARLYYYHVNDTKKPKRVVALAENVFGRLNAIEIEHGIISPPSEDYFHVGKHSQELYYGSKRADWQVFATHKTKLLSEDMAEHILKKDELICGIYDLDAKHPVRIYVLACPAKADPVEFLQHAKARKKDHVCLRGTYPASERNLRAEQPYNPQQDGVAGFLLADGVTDRFQQGTDALDGSSVVDVGNYGLNYHIDIPTAGEGKFRCYLRPLGGPYAGVMTVRAGEASAAPHFVPSNRPIFEEGNGKTVSESELLGVFEAGETLHFEYSPPGASNLPVQIVLAPEK